MHSGLPEYLRIVRKRRVFVLIAFVGCLLGAGFYSFLSTSIYEAEAKLFVGQTQISAAELTKGQTVTQLSNELLQSYAEIIKTHPITTIAVREARLRLDPVKLAEDIKADPIINTQLIRLRYRSANPVTAQRAVNGVAKAFVKDVQTIESPPGSKKVEPAVRVSIVAPALEPKEPVSPNKPLNFGLAAVMGILVGVGFAFLAEQLDLTVKNREELESSLDLPVLASVPIIQTRPQEIYLEGDNHSVFGETFHKLRTAVDLYAPNGYVQTILVTSAQSSEGKTTTALNLAAVYAYMGNRTLLVEADLRRPGLHNLFIPRGGYGLTLALLGTINVDEGIIATGINGLDCLPAASIPEAPVELLSSARVHEVFTQLRARYQSIVIDAPPLLPVADTSLLLPRVDGVILVARMNETRRDRLREAAELVNKAGKQVLGVVANAVTIEESAYDGYYQRHTEPSK